MRRMAAGIALVGCTNIATPVERELPAQPTDASRSDAEAPLGPQQRCAVVIQGASRGETARIYAGAVPDTVAFTIGALYAPSPETGPGNLLFSYGLAGAPTSLQDRVFELDLAEGRLQTCAYCIVLQRGCDASAENCSGAYIPVAGQARAVQASATPGAPVWLDFSNAEFARAELGPELEVLSLDRDDCIFSERASVFGTTDDARTPCSASSRELGCVLARSVAARAP